MPTRPNPIQHQSAAGGDRASIGGRTGAKHQRAACRAACVHDAARRQEPLEIQYTSLNLGAADRARFRYRLSPRDGPENKWTRPAPGALRVMKLPPGPYRFQVQACNEDGVWNETGASLAVTILPFFWQTNSFRALAAAALLGLVAAAFISSRHRNCTGRWPACASSRRWKKSAPASRATSTTRSGPA
jgi:hypothetical protein